MHDQEHTSLNPQNILQHISAIMPHYCDKCGHKHDPADVEVVFNANNKAVCKLGCKNCGNTYMMHINSPVEGMLAAKRAPFKSEITAKEINKFSNVTHIASDELIHVYDELQSVQTIEDFNKLF